MIIHELGWDEQITLRCPDHDVEVAVTGLMDCHGGPPRCECGQKLQSASDSVPSVSHH